MALPEFTANDLLPAGIHPASPDDVRARFVQSFPRSTTRDKMFRGLEEYQSSLSNLGLHVTQWIDGSFVDRSRLDPADVDVANFCRADNLNAIPPTLRDRALYLLQGGEKTKPEFSCHTFLMVEQPPGHALESLYNGLRKYFRDCFATAQRYAEGRKTPDVERGQKGIIQMQVGDATLAPRP